jgi:Protein of unknown function (DUF2442)
MSASDVSRPPAPRAESVSITADGVVVQLSDGRVVKAPLASLPRLRAAMTGQPSKWDLFSCGVGIPWSEIDEDLSAAGLLALPD